MNALQALAIAAAAFVTSLSVDGAPRLPSPGAAAARELAYVRADLAELAPFLDGGVWISDAASAKTCDPAHSYGRL